LIILFVGCTIYCTQPTIFFLAGIVQEQAASLVPAIAPPLLPWQ
jgi:hypothetical protein